MTEKNLLSEEKVDKRSKKAKIHFREGLKRKNEKNARNELESERKKSRKDTKNIIKKRAERRRDTTTRAFGQSAKKDDVGLGGNAGMGLIIALKVVGVCLHAQ